MGSQCQSGDFTDLNFSSVRPSPSSHKDNKMKAVALLCISIAAVLLTPSEAFFPGLMNSPFGMYAMLNGGDNMARMMMFSSMMGGGAGGSGSAGSPMMMNPMLPLFMLYN